MADGDPFVQTKVLVKYYDNAGKAFRRKIFSGYNLQAALGWTAGSPADATLPKGIRPRHCTTLLASGKYRKIIVATDAALTALVPGTTVLFADVGGIQKTAIVHTLEGEHSIGQG